MSRLTEVPDSEARFFNCAKSRSSSVTVVRMMHDRTKFTSVHQFGRHYIQQVADILCKESPYDVSVLLSQEILPPVAPVRDRIGEMLSTIQLQCETGLVAQKIDLRFFTPVERDRQRGVDAEAPLGLGKVGTAKLAHGLIGDLKGAIDDIEALDQLLLRDTERRVGEDHVPAQEGIEALGPEEGVERCHFR